MDRETRTQYTGNKSNLRVTTEIGIFFIFMIDTKFNYYQNSASQQGNKTTIGAPFSTKLGTTYCRNQVDRWDNLLLFRLKIFKLFPMQKLNSNYKTFNAN